MENQSVTLNRWFVGLITVACLAGAAYVRIQHPGELFWWGSLFRAAIVLGTLWFCLPTRDRPAAWANFSPTVAALVIGVLLLAMIRPRLGLPILIGFLLFRAILTRWRGH